MRSVAKDGGPKNLCVIAFVTSRLPELHLDLLKKATHLHVSVFQNERAVREGDTRLCSFKVKVELN